MLCPITNHNWLFDRHEDRWHLASCHCAKNGFPFPLTWRILKCINCLNRPLLNLFTSILFTFLAHFRFHCVDKFFNNIREILFNSSMSSKLIRWFDSFSRQSRGPETADNKMATTSYRHFAHFISSKLNIFTL